MRPSKGDSCHYSCIMYTCIQMTYPHSDGVNSEVVIQTYHLLIENSNISASYYVLQLLIVIPEPDGDGVRVKEEPSNSATADGADAQQVRHMHDQRVYLPTSRTYLLADT